MEHFPSSANQEEHLSDPAIMGVEEEGEGWKEAVTPRASGIGGGHDWQLVDDGLLSQCGSSPRSLSRLDLEVASEAHLPAEDTDGDEDEQEIASQMSIAGEAAAEALGAEFVEAESASKASMEVQAAVEGLLGSRASTESQADAADAEATQLGEEDAKGDGGEGMGSMSSPGPNLSSRSSYADVSLPEEDAPEGEEEVELSEGALLDMLGEIGMEADLESRSQSSAEDDSGYPRLDIPDTGVFSIATGFPVGTPFESVASRPLSFARLSVELPELASAVSSSDAMSTASSMGSRFPRPESEDGKDRWAMWRHRVVNGKAGVLLQQLWRHVQLLAARVGERLPNGVRKRIAAVLRHVARGGGHTGVAYGTAVLGFWLAWHYYSRTRALERLTAAQSHDYDLHVLKVLAISEGLSRSVPITRPCGFKPHNFGMPNRAHPYPSRPLGFSGASL